MFPYHCYLCIIILLIIVIIKIVVISSYNWSLQVLFNEIEAFRQLIISQPKRISDKMQHDHSMYFVFIIIQGDREVRGGEGWPAEGNRDPAEGKGQVGIRAGGPQPCVQTAPWRTPSELALPAVCTPSSDHALQPGSPGTDEYPQPSDG